MVIKFSKAGKLRHKLLAIAERRAIIAFLSDQLHSYQRQLAVAKQVASMQHQDPELAKQVQYARNAVSAIIHMIAIVTSSHIEGVDNGQAETSGQTGATGSVPG